MITIDKIDFSVLKPYDGKVTKCFEQLCFQIAQREYGHLGRFTAIDGSGGDGGVEFYLELNSGEKWGWQCKFYQGAGRLNESNRARSIEDSLCTACRNHPSMTKWFLCLKTDLTTNSLSSKGKFTKGEQDWFDNSLPALVPSSMSLDIKFWGESALLQMLNQTQSIGLKSFFFGVLEFDQEWFKRNFDENFEKVKDKYDQDVHTLDRYTKSIIDLTLLDTRYIDELHQLELELSAQHDNINLRLSEFRDIKVIDPVQLTVRNAFCINCKKFDQHFELVKTKIASLICAIKDFDIKTLTEFNSKELEQNFYAHLANIDYHVFAHDTSAFREASAIAHLISEYGQHYSQFFRNYFSIYPREINFLAGAAKGKTHLSCDIAYKRIESGTPAIFLTGDKFTEQTSIIEALLKNLDIEKHFTFQDFLQALDVYADIIKKRIPIIIDGLNETTFNRYFSDIWKNHLDAFSKKIQSTRNLVLITTCRSSYKKRIWGELNDSNKFTYLNGFDSETVMEAVTKYFNKYRIHSELFFAQLDRFRDPIFIRIYCEIKNPSWKTGVEVDVNIEQDSTYAIFKSYIRQINSRVTNAVPFLKTDEQFITECLTKISDYLWKQNLREIPVKTFYELIDGNSEYQKDHSKAEILMHEGLIVTRDMRSNDEFLSITYDILAGFLISETIILKHANPKYFLSSHFIDKINEGNSQHPLYEDIIAASTYLLPELKGVMLHTLIRQDPKIRFTKSKLYRHLPKFLKDQFKNRLNFANFGFSMSLTTLFSLPSDYVTQDHVELVTDIFNRNLQSKELYKLCLGNMSSIGHPLNGSYFSRFIGALDMNIRDTTWTEYIRKNQYELIKFLEYFEEQCRNYAREPDAVINKQHLIAGVVKWILTSTSRLLRDKATRALYFYGRKFPEEFAELVYDSLKANDPYVPERTLASLYGVAMAIRSLPDSKVKNEVLPEISKRLYDLMFKEMAPYSTTHLLSRDYARRIIEIAVDIHPTILKAEEIAMIRPPYPVREEKVFGEFDYGDYEYGDDLPVQMDFSNYTLGRIVEDGGSYANPPEKVKARRQLYWRIYNLGWSKEMFAEIEVSVNNDIPIRTERSKVERYGKKYSWIAFFELAGLRKDLGLFKSEPDEFRISEADIDPSFPVKEHHEKFITDDLLGDRTVALYDWYENGGMPFIEKYLERRDLLGEAGTWILMDGYDVQEDVSVQRSRFTFLRCFLVKNDDYEEILKYLNTRNFGGRWLPEKRENYYTFSGELLFPLDATKSNFDALRIVTGIKEIEIKKTDPGFFAEFFSTDIDEDINPDESVSEDHQREACIPEFITRQIREYKEVEVLLPVMEYSWESYHSDLNDAGGATVLSKELAEKLALKNRPQTFDLFDEQGIKACMSISFYENYNNNHRLTYLRKDKLDSFLSANGFKMITIIWGERQAVFQSESARTEFYNQHPFKNHQVFQKVFPYT